MMAQDPITVTFHPDAAARFNEMAQEILQSVESFGPMQPPAPSPVTLHPVVEIPLSTSLAESRSSGRPSTGSAKKRDDIGIRKDCASAGKERSSSGSNNWRADSAKLPA
jgi:hypothetical protein